MRLHEVTQEHLDKFKKFIPTSIDPVPNVLTWMDLVVKFKAMLEIQENLDEEGEPCWYLKKNCKRIDSRISTPFQVQSTRFAYYMYDQECEKHILDEQYKRMKRPKKFLRTTCHNTHCVNPDHLFESFTAYSHNDPPKVPKGSACKMSKLTEEQVIEIRSSPNSLATLSCIYGVSKPAVSNIKRGFSWRHLLPTNNTQGEKQCDSR
jgi:hypothetical protein